MATPLELTDDEVRALETHFVVRDGVLGVEVARQIADAARRIAHDGELHRAGVSRSAVLNEQLRGDAITWLDRANAPAPLLPLLELFEEVRRAANGAAYLGLGNFDVQLAMYPGGGARYVRHRDAFAGATTAPQKNRRLTAIYYANPDWRPEHGGVLRVFPGGGDRGVEVEPVLDRLVLFLSDRLDHEVLPAHAERLAITAWYYGR